jgi:hypothetical protein
MLISVCSHRLLPLALASASAALLAGCASGRDGHWRHYDHSYYRPAEGDSASIFIDPVGWRDRTVPNKLGALDVKRKSSFASDPNERAARQRSQLYPRLTTQTPPAAAPQAPESAQAATPTPPAQPLSAPAQSKEPTWQVIMPPAARPAQPEATTIKPGQLPIVDVVPADATTRGTTATRRKPPAD